MYTIYECGRGPQFGDLWYKAYLDRQMSPAGKSKRTENFSL